MPTNMEPWIPHVILHSKRTVGSNNPFTVCRMGQLASSLQVASTLVVAMAMLMN